MEGKLIIKYFLYGVFVDAVFFFIFISEWFMETIFPVTSADWVREIFASIALPLIVVLNYLVYVIPLVSMVTMVMIYRIVSAKKFMHAFITGLMLVLVPWAVGVVVFLLIFHSVLGN